MPRQSTTAKVTKTHAQMIGAECNLPYSGVIVRRQGVEYGVTRVVKTSIGYVAHTYEGTIIALSACTVRKTTLDHLPQVTPAMVW